MARRSHTAGAMHCAYIACAQCGSLSVGGSEILSLLANRPRILGAHIRRRTISDILRANEAMSSWFVVEFVPLGVGVLILHGHDIHRVLIWITFGWFLFGALLPGYRSEHL